MHVSNAQNLYIYGILFFVGQSYDLTFLSADSKAAMGLPDPKLTLFLCLSPGVFDPLIPISTNLFWRIYLSLVNISDQGTQLRFKGFCIIL